MDLLEILVVCTAVVTVIVFILFRKRNIPPDLDTIDIVQLGSGFARLQREAFLRFAEGRSIGLQDYVRTSRGLSIVYTIEEKEGKVVHLVSGKAPGSPRQYLMENMLLIFGILVGQLKEAGAADSAQMEIVESETGTHFIMFTLDQEKHAALRRIVEAHR